MIKTPLVAGLMMGALKDTQHLDDTIPVQPQRRRRRSYARREPLQGPPIPSRSKSPRIRRPPSSSAAVPMIVVPEEDSEDDERITLLDDDV